MDRIRRSKNEDPVGMFIYDFDMDIDWNDDVRRARAAAVNALQERANRRIGRDGRRVSSFGVPNYHTIGGGTQQGYMSGRRESRQNQNYPSQDRLSIQLDTDVPSQALESKNRREPHHKSSLSGLSNHHKNHPKGYSPNPSSGPNSGATSPRGHQTITRGSLQMFSQEHLGDGQSDRVRSENKRKKGSFSVDPPSSRVQSSHPSFNDNHGSMAHNAAFSGFMASTNEQLEMKPMQSDATVSGGRSHRHGSLLGSSAGM